ncbi:FecR domain-containing protein [uncultured Alistipes sp.]|uniref:FecR family protein n=1 Tax=uncultured Alistipes sp. TaxID=538949 RepID=UPI0027D957C1|nr:FecR domain-containing protein [uncultured Alistipes sp.]
MLTKTERSELVLKLIYAIMDEQSLDEIHQRLLGWLESEASEEEKLEALEKYMYDNLQPNDDLTRESTLRKFNELINWLKIDVPSVQNPKAIEKKAALMRILPRAAAAILIPAALFLGSYLWLDRAKPVEPEGFVAAYTVSVPADSVRHIVLDDGTEVTINGNTEFAYNDGRECKLQGEGYFKVAKNEQPFVIHADCLDVTVLGTEFNLRAYDRSEVSTVTLYSGTVKVDYQEGSQILEPGTEFSYNNVTGRFDTTLIDPVRSKLRSAWKEGDTLLLFPLSDIFTSIEMVYKVEILKKDIVDTDKKYSLRFDGSEPLDVLMSMLRDVSDEFDYLIEGNTVVLKEKK